MKHLAYEAADEEATAALGAALAGVLPKHAVVALSGPLGAGKTRLVQALAAAAGVDPRAVVSPTFVLIQEYCGRHPIYHFDAYRLADDDEFLQLGPEEYFARPGWCLVEWAERVQRCLPQDRLEIRIGVTGPTSRRFELTAQGGEHEAALDALAASHPAQH